MVGFGLILVGRRLLPGTNLLWLDPVAAIAVALLIVRAAWTLTKQSGRDLMDASLPADEIAWIRQRLNGLAPAVRGFHHLRTRKAGAARFVEFHLVVDKDLTVERAHNLADAATRDIKAHLPEATVTIHVEPCDGKCRPACLEGCLLTEEERAAIRADAAAMKAGGEPTFALAPRPTMIASVVSKVRRSEGSMGSAGTHCCDGRVVPCGSDGRHGPRDLRS